MVLVAALFLAAVPAEQRSPGKQPVVAEREAVATVRILPGAQLRFSEIEKTAPESFSDAQVRGAHGLLEPARLVEFQ